MDERRDKTYWHQAFCEALELELYEYKDVLDFDDEKQLSKEALKIDIVVIKKEKGVDIEKNIGRIFKGYNLFEYKSETDSLSIADYNKVFGYSYLYSAFEIVPVADITVSFVVTMYPRELIKYLKNECGHEVVEAESGVYYVKGDMFPVQILERKALSKEGNLFLKNLASGLSVEDISDTLSAYEAKKKLDPKNVYLDRLINANWRNFKEVLDMNKTLQDLFIESSEEEGWIKNMKVLWQQEAAQEMAQEMLADGEPVEKIIKWTKLSSEAVKKLVV